MHGHRCARYAVAALLVALAACSDDTTAPATSFTAGLSSHKELPDTITANVTGSASCSIDASAKTVTCTVSWSGTTGDVTAAHIHSGTASQNGTVRVNLCGAGTAPACPAGTSASISSGAQPVAATFSFEALVPQLRTYGAYVNIHTAAHTGGEARGQIFGVY